MSGSDAKKKLRGVAAWARQTRVSAAEDASQAESEEQGSIPDFDDDNHVSIKPGLSRGRKRKRAASPCTPPATIFEDSGSEASSSDEKTIPTPDIRLLNGGPSAGRPKGSRNKSSNKKSTQVQATKGKAVARSGRKSTKKPPSLSKILLSKAKEPSHDYEQQDTDGSDEDEEDAYDEAGEIDGIDEDTIVLHVPDIQSQLATSPLKISPTTKWSQAKEELWSLMGVKNITPKPELIYHLTKSSNKPGAKLRNDSDLKFLVDQLRNKKSPAAWIGLANDAYYKSYLVKFCGAMLSARERKKTTLLSLEQIAASLDATMAETSTPGALDPQLDRIRKQLNVRWNCQIHPGEAHRTINGNCVKITDIQLDAWSRAIHENVSGVTVGAPPRGPMFDPLRAASATAASPVSSAPAAAFPPAHPFGAPSPYPNYHPPWPMPYPQYAPSPMAPYGVPNFAYFPGPWTYNFGAVPYGGPQNASHLLYDESQLPNLNPPYLQTPQPSSTGSTSNKSSDMPSLPANSADPEAEYGVPMLADQAENE
ncbi:hypothetical protein DL93DRAFT_2096475 [Clavulina sp. PMI_390]|nr:hypothetical protein DL93DRAFT_2096475 [Clavulina sp. PMI_390]